MSNLIAGSRPYQETASETFRQEIFASKSERTWSSSPYGNHHARQQEIKTEIALLQPLLARELGSSDVALQVVEKAQRWIEDMFIDAMLISRHWLCPHLSVSEESEIVFEWDKGPKSLTVYIQNEQSIYVAAWGADIENQMNDGMADSAFERRKIWSWLIS